MFDFIEIKDVIFWTQWLLRYIKLYNTLIKNQNFDMSTNKVVLERLKDHNEKQIYNET